jgi:hypothetical protein
MAGPPRPPYDPWVDTDGNPAPLRWRVEQVAVAHSKAPAGSARLSVNPPYALPCWPGRLHHPAKFLPRRDDDHALSSP